MPSESRTNSFSIKAVVFDLDGLMFNTEDIFNISGRELVRRRGKELTEEVLSQMMGRRAHEAFEIMVELLELTEPVEELLAESSEIFYAQLEHRLEPMPGLLELLDHIETYRLPKGVATSSHRKYLEDILGRYDLLSRFQMTLSAEDVTHGKPHPEIYLKVAECLGISPAEMLVLEDSEAGTQSAAAANAVVVSVPNQHSKNHDFSTATYVAESLIDPFVLQLLR